MKFIVNSVLSILIITLSVSFTNAQTVNDKSKIISKETFGNKFPVFFEKAYLHLDREEFATGDDIWFKAYVVNGQSNYLMTNSNNLYVELIAPDMTMANRIVVRLDNGLGYGDFKLGDSIPSGSYRIRAYTKWMLNFSDHFIFEKNIVVRNSLRPKIITVNEEPKTTKKPKKGEVVSNVTVGKVDIRFLPEGGAMIADVMSNVAFKAVDIYGNGFKTVQGVIITSKNDTIANFASIYLGMGTVGLLPNANEKYVAIGMADSIPFKVELPSVLTTGYSIRINNNVKDSLFTVTISTNAATLAMLKNEELMLQGRTFNKPNYGIKFGMTSPQLSLRLPKSAFPNGIARITVYDHKKIPQCERAIYIEHKNTMVNVAVTTDKKNYSAREAITLKIKTTNEQNQPITANLSLSVTDAGIIQNPSNNIMSYLMLESEIKGKIENPTYYFDPSNTNRYKMLDLLLVTQGWRDFLWKQITDTMPTLKIKYLMEQGFGVSGRLKMLLLDRPLTDKEIIFYLQTITPAPTKGSEKVKMTGAEIMKMKQENTTKSYKTKTDSVGKFYFDGLDFYGKKKIVLKANKESNGVTKGLGELLMDSLFIDPFKISSYKYALKPLPEIDIFSKEMVNKNKIMRKYTLKDTMELDEVVVKAKSVANEVQLESFIMNGLTPDYDFSSKDFEGYSDVQGFILDKISKASLDKNGKIVIRSMGNEKKPNYILDLTNDVDEDSNIDDVESDTDNENKQSTMNEQIIYGLSMDQIDRILISSRNPTSTTGNVEQYTIAVFTKPGALNKRDFSMIVTNVQGYYQPRVFYSNDYSVISKNDLTPDLRSTLYWNPNIKTNENGEAEVKFYHCDTKSKIRTSVEGITEKGVPIISTSYFNAK